ncbi:MAG TPA: hypothetical protein VMS98_08080 [Thermoanaerobaculia bacterium]|nr:hypothetical protein [Thermoanaerobaculia bacterium]
MSCCAHGPAEHHVIQTCEQVIHYPSEDYPCLCSGFEQSAQPDVCMTCEHALARHAVMRVCRPDSDDFCECRLVSA